MPIYDHHNLMMMIPAFGNVHHPLFAWPSPLHHDLRDNRSSDFRFLHSLVCLGSILMRGKHMPGSWESVMLCFYVWFQNCSHCFCVWFQSYEREAHARQLEVAELRKTGEAHRKRVKALEQEVASQRVIAKVCSESIRSVVKAVERR